MALSGPRLALLERVVKRLQRLQRLVGYGHFNLLSFDRGMRLAGRHSAVGAFTRGELDFLEEIFFEDASRYGFYGAKVLREITASIPRRDVHKVPGSGHYLFKGRSLSLYRKVKKDVGRSLILTSGVRGIVKQMLLFLSKAVSTGGDLSLASRSLAPPGHSYHGIGDFDIGKRGFGKRNFMSDFATTDEFRRLAELGYVTIRYPNGNPFGVRFEPWHIRVT